MAMGATYWKDHLQHNTLTIISKVEIIKIIRHKKRHGFNFNAYDTKPKYCVTQNVVDMPFEHLLSYGTSHI